MVDSVSHFSFSLIRCLRLAQPTLTPMDHLRAAFRQKVGLLIFSLKGLQKPKTSVINVSHKSNVRLYIWIKIDKNILQLDKDILLCSCYNPPSHSSYFTPDTLPNLENVINRFKKDYFVVLAGDLIL